ncbi:endonuclease domain-containing protein [Roseibium sediminis]|uniref:endonuclease domain-containing protein n=1 Tax=Roseibium sediminis TaxID=1775174 RepID=UPI00123CE409|nr:DUF559 domain-containing protein [Roseibium sediminis]
MSVARARALRRRQTEAERLLWSRLRNRRLNGWKFRRQHPIDRFVVDFVSLDAKLIVELDGSGHGMREASDQHRTLILESLGFRVQRYCNVEVQASIETVLEDILTRLEKI